MSDAAPASPESARPSKSKAGMIALFLGVLNLGATGFLVFETVTAHPVEQPVAAAPGPSGDAAKVSGPIATLDPFVVNLRDEGVSRYLKASFELELASEAAAGELAEAKRAVRDDLLRYLSGLSVDDTLGEEGKNKIQETMVARLDKQLGPGRVRRVFFTEFVVQ